MHILLVNNSVIPVFAYGGTERVIWQPVIGKIALAFSASDCNRIRQFFLASPLSSSFKGTSCPC